MTKWLKNAAAGVISAEPSQKRDYMLTMTTHAVQAGEAVATALEVSCAVGVI